MKREEAVKARPVNLTIPQELLDQIDRAAALENRSRSEFIREAVRGYMREKGLMDTAALGRYRKAVSGIEERQEEGAMRIEGKEVTPIVIGMPPGGSCGFLGLPGEVRLVNTGKALVAAYREVGGDRYYLVGKARLEPAGIALTGGWFTVLEARPVRGKRQSA